MDVNTLRRLPVIVVPAVIAVFVICLWAGGAAQAFASDPPAGPMQIDKFDFDTPGLPSRMRAGVVPMSSDPPAIAYWGQTTAVKRGTTGGSLWCAGAQELHPYTAPATFWPSYPWWGQLVQQINEPIVLSGTTPRRLMQRGIGGSPVSSIVVRNTAGTVTYSSSTDYTVAVDVAGYTTIARRSGTTIPDGATVHVSYRWPTHGTRGDATVDLDVLKDYYRSWVSFYYLMPSLGVSDANSFSVQWYDITDRNKTEALYPFALTTSTGWLRIPEQGHGLELSAGDEVNLSRKSGEFNFRFWEFRENKQKPENGQGAAVDDVVISGFKYGPVRGLTASTTDTAGVTVSWNRPYRAYGSTATEEREISYRIWRRPAGGPTWTHLARVADTQESYFDSTAASGVQYEYLVIAYDPGTGEGYGEIAPAVQGLRPASTLAAFTMTPNITTVERGKPVTFTYRIENIGSVELTGITLSDSFGAITGTDVPSALLPGQVSTLQRQRYPQSSAEVTATLRANSSLGSVDLTLSVYITVTDPPPPPPPPTSPPRISGVGRIETAIEVARNAYPRGAANVVVATGYDYPDALSASALAGALNGPLLLVRPTVAPDSVLKAIRDLGATTAYIIGGTGVVSDGVERQIDALPGVFTVRLQGTNRYDTARVVAERVKAITPPNTTSTVFLATGLNFPDALAASSLAAHKGWPVLLTRHSVLPPETHAALRALRPTRVIICGGTGAVSSAVENAIRGKAEYGSPQVTRMPGLNRYDTAKRLIDWGKSASGGNLAPSGIEGVYLSTGVDFPDALSAGVLAAKSGREWRPLMLTHSMNLSPEAAEVISRNPKVAFVTVIGGVGAVSDEVEKAARNLIP